MQRRSVADTTSPLREFPKADLHVHAEAGARLDTLLAGRGERAAYDWAAWASEIAAELPPGQARLMAMSRELVPPEVDADPIHFRARIEQLLLDAAATDAVYVEVRFGRETVTRDDFMTHFREAERRVTEHVPHSVPRPWQR
jgi:hypothetical protein